MELTSRFALPVAAAVVGGMYLDAKHHIVKDITAWRARRQFNNNIAECARLMGDYCTLYHAIDYVDPKAEALWFEGRSWTYADLKREADRLAQWFVDEGIRTKGIFPFYGSANSDFVAVYMTNSAEAYMTSYALSKLGVTNAMINSSLKGTVSSDNI